MHPEGRETRFPYTDRREPTSAPCSIYRLPEIDKLLKDLAVLANQPPGMGDILRCIFRYKVREGGSVSIGALSQEAFSGIPI